MDWPNGVNDGLILTRAIHFAATAITTGALIFQIAVEKPAIRSAGADTVVRTNTLPVAWIGLGTATVSGVIWFLVQAAAMSGLSFQEMIAGDLLSKVLSDTQFGFVAEIRLALAILLAAFLAYDEVEQTDNCVWLHDRQCITNFREQPIETYEYRSVDDAKGLPLGQMPALYANLMPKD